MSFRLGRCLVKSHPLLPVLWGTSLLLGSSAALTGMLSALLLHEAGHLLAALVLGLPVLQIELSPLGGLITMDETEGIGVPQGVFLSAAGPIFSFLGCYLAAFLRDMGVHEQFVRSLAQGSLILLLVNLLPALPLDGGNMLRYLLRPVLSWQRAGKILVGTGYFFGCCFCGLTLFFAFRGQAVLSPMLAGLYLLYAAAQEGRQAPGRYVTSLIARRARLDQTGAIKTEILAVSGEMPCRRLLSCLSPGKYHIVHVVAPDGMRSLGRLDEQELCELILNHGNDPIGAHIKNGPKAAEPE